STYSENNLSMRAGLATLRALQEERLGERAERLGAQFRQQLTHSLSGFEMVSEVRGLGMLNGIVFRPPSKLPLRLPFEAFRKVHEGMFGQMLVMRLFRDHKILTQVCGNNLMVLKAAPPLLVSEQQLEEFVRAVRSVVEMIHSSSTFWLDALQLARRAVSV
ncbi:MAG: aminotransferase class III-fold pyridoxal phosphate-dependent enzyme, partial [Terriglobales bacterium]